MKCSLIFTMLFWSLAYSLFFYVLGCSSNWRFTVWPDSRSLQRNSAGMIINSLNVSSKGGEPKSNFEKVEDVAAFQVLLRQGRSIISQENICANKIQPAMWMYVSSWAIFLQFYHCKLLVSSSSNNESQSDCTKSEVAALMFEHQILTTLYSSRGMVAISVFIN